MLSYRHSYHAGNHGDVIKHIVLVEILEHLLKKETPFVYIDTHAGAGLFHLHSAHGEKLKEYRDGIGKLNPGAWPELARYLSIVASVNPAGKLDYYPGSPLIASTLLRSQDKGWLFELHPGDYSCLHKNISRDRRFHVRKEDGFVGLPGLLPVSSRRGLILVDPSYEIKSDYQRVVEVVARAYKKAPTCCYATWYPVIKRKSITRLVKEFVNSGIRKIDLYELCLRADDEKGMTASGMLVINPPWQLREKMSVILPRLAQTLAPGTEGGYTCGMLVDEQGNTRAADHTGQLF